MVAISRAQLNINTSQQSLFIDDSLGSTVSIYTTSGCLVNAHGWQHSVKTLDENQYYLY